MVLFFASTAIAFVAAIWLALLLRRRNRRIILYFFAAATFIFATLANPLVRFVVFASDAERARNEMLWSALDEGCVGKPAPYLVERFGQPFRVVAIGDERHWWYRPGPSYFVHEDYVGFAVKDGRIVNAYIQVN